MWYMDYDREIKEFTTKKELEDAIAKILDNNGLEELKEMTVIEGEKCAVTALRVMPTVSVSSPVKGKAVVKNAKKK